ncbi:MAG: family 43 glycosylhydrolase [Dysgonamonadaceae bacterium]|jgi:beta-xylosidase/endo-1,4-beta-D-glucanase Y|nr:family 43 glycosylhydrolase [Dysgonamonadaceae bacterium]
MKKVKSILILAAVSMFMINMFSCKPSGTEQKAVFGYFAYKGTDATFTAVNAASEYQNPVLSGFYPDPSVCRKGNDYYLVTSTFAYYPGIPVFHSTDLVNWVQLGHVLNRRSQLQLDGIRLSGGVYAPTIRYNPRNDMFYVINTCVDGIGNFIVKTKDPKENNWSEPIVLPSVGGIDPDIFFDDDGKAYIVHNDEPPVKPEWNGHRAIWLHEFDTENDLASEEKICLIDGGTDKAKHPIWIEAPHLYKIDGYYYLMCAEGGTSTEHSEVIFRSDHVKGPYIPWKGNPILTQRDLPADRPSPVTCAGHADLIQTETGDWYAVFLACRPYEDNYFNTGRESFLLPVTWNGGYPVIQPKGAAVPYTVEKQGLSPNPESYKGNFEWRDEFDTDSLHNRWIFVRTPPEKEWWKQEKGKLTVASSGHTVYEAAHPAFIGARQQHLTFEAQTELEYAPAKEGDIAGLVCYQNESHNFVFGKTVNEQGKPCIIVNRAQGTVARLAETEIPEEYVNSPLTLKVTGNGGEYSFFLSYDKGENWTAIVENADAKNLSTQVAGGFTGVALGMYIYTNPAPKKGNLQAWDKGAFETREYRNLFAEAGYTEEETDAKLADLFYQVFEGENRVYFEVGDSMAYISDLKNHDVRTEGMSYGLMVAVQFDRRDIFDRLWRWGVKYMQHKEGRYKGYFAWSCKTDGTHNAEGPASDGELYYITSLLFAANRWGNDGEINYLKEAQYILDCAFAKNASDDGITNFIDTARRLINFTPEAFWGATFTDPSYHIPAFYEVWARWAHDGRSEFWRECAQKTREYLHKSVHPVTALNADQNEFDGSVRENKLPNGMVFRNEAFRFDSWRVPMNIALDYSWCCEDREWQREYGHKFQNFLYLQGINTFVDQYNMDGSQVQWILPAGGKVKLRHSLGLVATAAAVSLACTHPKSYEFIDHFWQSENKPYDDGYFDAYYDGLLQLFAFMHLSGNYRIVFSD